jgi:acyl-CoA synthetase (AMP-forming)/AMP-acid ligase II
VVKSSDQDPFLWISHPPAAGVALHFASASWSWQRHTYESLARLTLQMADGFLHFGIRRNDVVVIVLPGGSEFVAALFGSMLAGAIPSVVAPPRAFQSGAAYDSHLCNVLETASPRLVLTSAELVPSVVSVPGTKTEVITADELVNAGASGSATPRPARADLALLQFTAGSSGQVRGVRVSYKALEANVAAIRSWLDWSSHDSAAFWVPHYHDMGLIGGLIAPMASQCDVWLLSPEQFVRRPLEYLRCFGERGARLTALPAFGLEYMTRRIRQADLHGMDFSAVKGFVVGAELIDPATLTRFRDLLLPFGLPPNALLPAYGLAEATLAVTGVPLGQTWTARSPSSGAAPVVGCGRPLGETEVAIVGEDAKPLPEAQIGEIVIHGTSVASGYNSPQSSSSLTIFAEGVLRSGDAGFVVGGELFPVGRLGDSIKIRGRSLFAELLETELTKAGYPREHNSVVLGMRDGSPAVVWISERLGGRDPREAVTLLSRLTEGAAVLLIQAARGAIPRTSSGKPRRRMLWNAFIHDRVSGTVTSEFGPKKGDLSGN